MKRFAILLGIIALLWTSAHAQLFCSYKKEVKYPFPTFYSLQHFPDIFSNKDINILQSSKTQMDKQKKNYRCFVKHYEKYANYKRLVNVGLKRYEKKMYREDRRTQKYGNRFVNTVLMIYLDLDSLYSAKIIDLQARTKLNDSVKYIIDGLKQDIQELTFQIGETKSQALSTHGADKTNLFIKAIKLNKQKIDLKEDYIAFLLGDGQKTAMLQKRYASLKQKQIAQTPGQGQNQGGHTQKQQGQQTGDQQTNQRQQQYSTTTYYIWRIDQFSQKLNLSTQDKAWLIKYRDAQNNIQNLEAQLSNGTAKDKNSVYARLAQEYWNSFFALYNIYKNYVPEEANEKIYSYYSMSKQLYDKYQKNKDIYLLWQADHYLGAAVIMQENYLGRKLNTGTPYLTSDILPVSSTAQKTQKPKTTTPKKPTTTKPGKKIKCTPSGLVYTYSIDNPRPAILRETGTYYRVYVGTTTRTVIPKEFTDYQPITYVKVCRETKYRQKRYYVGRFTSYQEAKKAASRLYTQYGIHTKVVKFINGRPATALPVTPEKTQSHPATGVKNIHQTKYLVYAVRIGTYSDPKKPSELKHLSSLYYSMTPDGKYAYYDGLYYSYTSAQKALSKLQNLGYHDAYIQAFNNGQKISLDRARKIEANVHGQGTVIFGIQVGAYSKPLSQQDYRKIFGRLGANYQISMIKKGQMYVYYVYAGTSYNQAKQMKAKVRNLGYNDAFIIALRDNKVIPLSEAIK